MLSTPLIRRALLAWGLLVFGAFYYVALMRWTWPWRPATWLYFFVRFPIQQALQYLLIGAIVFVPLELLARRHEKSILRPGVITDVLHATVGIVLAAVPLFFLAGFISLASIDASADFITSQPRWLQIVGALLFREFLAYWGHRTTHMIPFLWRFHEVHHSSPELDWLSAVRRHPLDLVWVTLVRVVPLGLTGFQAVDIAFLYVASAGWALYIHSNTKWRLRFFGPVLVTAEYHHWHHVSAREDHDKNYGEFTGLFDKVFGTYLLPADRRPDDYGTSGDLSDGFTDQLLLRRRASTRRRNPSLRSSMHAAERTR